MVNFTMLDCIHRVSRIQLQSDISVQNCNTFRFPRVKHLNASFEAQDKEIMSESVICNNDLPCNGEIIYVMNKAKEDAFNALRTLEIEIDINVAEKLDF